MNQITKLKFNKKQFFSLVNKLKSKNTQIIWLVCIFCKLSTYKRQSSVFCINLSVRFFSSFFLLHKNIEIISVRVHKKLYIAWNILCFIGFFSDFNQCNGSKILKKKFLRCRVHWKMLDNWIVTLSEAECYLVCLCKEFFDHKISDSKLKVPSKHSQ